MEHGPTQTNSEWVESENSIKYMNKFDAQVGVAQFALNAIGFKDVDITIAETNRAYHGDNNEVGPSVENAKAYNGNLIAHLRSMVGKL